MNRPKIIAIVGLPASGKTTLAKTFSGNLVDDPKDLEELLDLIRERKDLIIVSDPFLCIPNAREKLNSLISETTYLIEWIFFENNPDQCLINSKERLNQKVDNDIYWFSSKYIIPANVKPIPVYS